MVTDAKDFELLGDPLKMTGYSRPPENKLTAVTRVLGVCTAVAMLMMSVIGLLVGMFSPFLAQLRAKNSPLHLTLDETSWVASLPSPGRLLGAILGSIGVQYVGSKRTMLFGGFQLLLSWIFLIVANSSTWLYGVGLTHGLGIGIAFASFPVYLGEIVSPKSRGTLVSYAVSGIPVGSMVGNVLGTYLSKSVFAYIAMVPTIVYIGIFLCLPESPHYLIRMGKMEEAKKSILGYNPKVASVQVEFDSIQQFVTTSSSFTVMNQLRELITPRNRKIVMIILALNMFLQFSGLNTIVYYMEIILTDSKVTVIPPATVVIIANAFDIIAGWGSMPLADKYGRRVMWIISSGGAALCMFTAGVRFSLLGNGYDSAAQQWLPILAMIFFRIFLFIGLCSVPSIITSELIAPNIKSIVVCMANVFAGTLAFVSTKSYQPLVDALGDAYVLYVYATAMILAVLFGFTMIPGTKGRTLQDIQKMDI